MVLGASGAAWLVAHAAHQRQRSVGGQHIVQVVAIQPDLRGQRVRRALACGQRCHPAGLAHGVGAVPFAFHQHAAQQPVRPGGAGMVGGQVVVADGRVVAIAERYARQPLQPGVRVVRQVPEMVVGVDDGQQRLVAAGQELRARRLQIAHGRTSAMA